MRPHSRRARRRYHTERVIRNRQARFAREASDWEWLPDPLLRFRRIRIYEDWQRWGGGREGNLARASADRWEVGGCYLPDNALARRYAYVCGCRMCNRGWDTRKGRKTVQRRQQDRKRVAEGLADWEDDKLTP